MNLTVNIYNTVGVLLEVDTLTVNETSASTVNTLTEVVDAGCPATITVVKSGYYPYTMDIDNVYKEDRVLDITMVAIYTDIEAANYLEPHTSFFTFQDPCSFCVDYYFASSYGGEICWFVNNELYSKNESKGKACFCNVGDYQLKVRCTTNESVVEVPGCPPVVTQLWDKQYATIQTGNTIRGEISSLTSYLDQDLTTNLSIVEYRVGISYEIITEHEPLKDGEQCCYSRNEEVTIQTTIDLTRADANPELHTVTYTVVDPTGLTLEFAQSEFPLNLLIENRSISFNLAKLGVYNVTVEVNDLECEQTYVETFIVETCNFVVLEYIDCNDFELSNRSSATTMTYSLSDVADSATVVQSGTLEAQKAISLSFATTSLYIMTVTYTKDDVLITEEYVLNNYCNIEACFTAYIEDLLCSPEERCSPCPPESDLKQMFLFYNTYFMKINKLFNENSFYTALDAEGLDEITTLKQLMDEILSFCNRRSCTDSTNSAFSSSYQTQGPYDYVGRGNTLDKGCKTCK